MSKMVHDILIWSRHGFLEDVKVDVIVGMCIGVTVLRANPEGTCKW